MTDYKDIKVVVLDHGHVILRDHMGSDASICQAARISYANKGTSKDRQLIRYLMRNRHTSPFEMGELQFEIKMPIFVARQWIRHRTANVNEMSARYTQLPKEMFVPKEVAEQSTDNKQGRGAEITDDHILYNIHDANSHGYSTYEWLLGQGVAREIARGVLPLNTYTTMIWKIDLHNLLHFLDLRMHEHAQEEIREYAKVLWRIVAAYFPYTAEAFNDYVLEAYTLSAAELDMVRGMLHVYSNANIYGPQMANEYMNKLDNKFTSRVSKREMQEFRDKIMSHVPIGDFDE